MEYGCIGEHLPHSFSREIHEAIGGYLYELKELPESELASFLIRKEFRAVNVTIPYKEKVIPFLDELSPRAASVGAVNTILNRDGRLCGYNTDCIGLSGLVKRSGLSFQKKKVLILGTGGTSKTAYSVAAEEGAASIYSVSRTGREGALTYEEAAARHADADLLINTTPCGMYPDTNAVPLSLSDFPQLSGVIDAVYNPLRTCLIQEAEERGIPSCGGLYMLVSQAVAASHLFTGREIPDEETEQIYRAVLRQKRNLVLIGMPSCGKTTVGKILSEKMGQPFLDTDDCYTGRYGETPGQTIRLHGESYFRSREAEVISEAGKKNGMVIAVGGGSVLRSENVRELKKNGVLIWLDRSPDLLKATEDRPLSDTSEKIFHLAAERRPYYQSASDYVIPADESPKVCADLILSKWEAEEMRL